MWSNFKKPTIYTLEMHKIITSISYNITLAKQNDKFVRNTLNYQIYCRNALDLTMCLSYKATNLDILIISLESRW